MNVVTLLYASMRRLKVTSLYLTLFGNKVAAAQKPAFLRLLSTICLGVRTNQLIVRGCLFCFRRSLKQNKFLLLDLNVKYTFLNLFVMSLREVRP